MTAAAMLMGAATAPNPAPYAIAPEFLFRVTDAGVSELVATHTSSIPAYSLIADGPWAESYFAKKSLSTGKLVVNAVTIPAGAFTLEMWLRFAADTTTGQLVYGEYISSVQEIRMDTAISSITLTVGGSSGRVTASHPTSLATLQTGGKLHLAIVTAGGAGSAVKIFVNGVPGTSGTRGNFLGNTGYLDLLRTVKCEFAEVLLREGDATTVAADPLYIASGETTFKPPAGPYLLEE